MDRENSTKTKATQKYSIDFYKTYNLVPPTCGLVNKVTSPKGLRKFEAEGYTSYQLYSDLSDIYKGEPASLEPGIYWVLDICKVKEVLHWNHYLFVVDTDGFNYPVAEYLNQRDSAWVKEAIKLVKRYFAGEELDSTGITKIDYQIIRKSKWTKTKK